MPKTPRPPADADLRALLHFSSADGRIWLSGQRMLLTHAASLTVLRQELLATLGAEQTRRVLLRVGFASGQRDAALARQVRPNAPWHEMFAVGPQLHMLEGAVQVSAEKLELDPERGHFHGIFRWDHSWEADAQLRGGQRAEAPVCWMQLGYASGYTSAFMGRSVLFKEVQCAACGHAHCRIEGRPQSDWPDGDAMAADYTADSLISHLDALRSQVEQLRSGLEPPAGDELGPLLGESAGFAAALGLLRKAAATQVSVLLTGETGVGKERFARALHHLSSRRAEPFVAVNCAALPGELIESELFGAERGAFTGANTARPGRFERAHGGTLLLDEVGELPLPAQAKLLRVLQTGEVERLGATSARKVNVRVVAATHVDLQAAVAAGRFRSDLLYRLDVYPIRIPPLRERLGDLPLLAQHLLQRFSARHDKRVGGFTDRALAAMALHPWPGNVRELENLIERGVILVGTGEAIDASHLFPRLPQADDEMALDASGHLRAPERSAAAPQRAGHWYDDLQQHGLTLEAMEDAVLHEAVRRAQGNLSAAARALGLTRSQLSYRLQRRGPRGSSAAAGG